jgi:small subunit ribosomal protein S3Ae
MWRRCEYVWGGYGGVANIGKQVHIRKVKLLKQPKFDLGSLMALHGESSTDEQGQKVEREFKETVLEQV